jgi:tetratricopeptide (TPR) repeat protein
VVLKGGSYFLPFTVNDNWQAAYSLLSFWHLVDLINACMLLSPFVLLLIPLALILVLQREVRWKPETIFLALTFVGAIGWMFVTNFEVGMSRDWDVLAPLSVGVVAFALHGLQHGSEEAGERRKLVLGMALVTLLHTVAWISVNADEDHSIARFAMLQDGRLRSQRAVAYACEDLAGFYRDRKQYAEAIPFLEQTVAIDSTNARRWLSLANVFQLSDQEENAMHAYEESARHGIRDKAAFFNLGVLYYNHSRLDDAIAVLQRAAEVDSADTLISSNLRMMLERKSAGHSLRQ